jgi:hypothetical protein
MQELSDHREPRGCTPILPTTRRGDSSKLKLIPTRKEIMDTIKGL